jgi:acyl-CoA hydrolase
LQKLVVNESLVYVYFKTSVFGKRSMHVWLEVWAGFWRSGALSLVVNNFMYMTENRYANKLYLMKRLTNKQYIFGQEPCTEIRVSIAYHQI